MNMPRHWIRRLLATGVMTTVAIGLLSAVPAARADNDDWHGRGDCKHENCGWNGNRNWHHHDDWRDRDDRFYYHSTPYYAYPPPAYYGPPAIGFGFRF